MVPSYCLGPFYLYIESLEQIQSLNSFDLIYFLDSPSFLISKKVVSFLQSVQKNIFHNL